MENEISHLPKVKKLPDFNLRNWEIYLTEKKIVFCTVKSLDSLLPPAGRDVHLSVSCVVKEKLNKTVNPEASFGKSST